MVCEPKFLGAGSGVGYGGGGAAETKAMLKAPPLPLLPLSDPSLVPFDRLAVGRLCAGAACAKSLPTLRGRAACLQHLVIPASLGTSRTLTPLMWRFAACPARRVCILPPAPKLRTPAGTHCVERGEQGMEQKQDTEAQVDASFAEALGKLTGTTHPNMFSVPIGDIC